MQFTEDNSPSENFITRYAQGLIEINHQKFEQSLLVFPDQATEIWACEEIGAVNQSNLSVVVEYQPELLIIGSGAKFAFPDFAVQAWLQANGIGCEVMDSAAACRTYNVLVTERRKVVAALLLP